RFEDLLYRDRAGAGSAAAMWRRKSFVEIDVKNIDAEISRPCNPHHRVKVRTIHVNERALRVKKVRDFGDLTFKDAQGVGIRDHDRRDVLIHKLPQPLE